ncbi:MAG: hypothetical protein VX498_00485 [Myxococcota bacterium]|nr:hypothetical protein [Myxococcota bacterium]
MSHVSFIRLATLTCTLALTSACASEAFLSTSNDEDLFPEFDGATLEVLSPQPAGIFLLDEAVSLEARILSSEGEVMDFESILWETDEEGSIAEGSSQEVWLDWGIRTVTVTAALPNGDRLQTILGGIRVQGRHTGIYGGDLAINLNAEFEGTPITASCLGGLNFIVDMSGEILEADEGSCTINLLVMGEMDIGYGVQAEVSDDLADGNIQINTGFFDLPIAFEGGFEDDELTAEFEGDAFVFSFDGSLSARRLSPYVD